MTKKYRTRSIFARKGRSQIFQIVQKNKVSHHLLVMYVHCLCKHKTSSFIRAAAVFKKYPFLLEDTKPGKGSIFFP